MEGKTKKTHESTTLQTLPQLQPLFPETFLETDPSPLNLGLKRAQVGNYEAPL